MDDDHRQKIGEDGIIKIKMVAIFWNGMQLTTQKDLLLKYFE